MLCRLHLLLHYPYRSNLTSPKYTVRFPAFIWRPREGSQRGSAWESSETGKGRVGEDVREPVDPEIPLLGKGESGIWNSQSYGVDRSRKGR